MHSSLNEYTDLLLPTNPGVAVDVGITLTGDPWNQWRGGAKVTGKPVSHTTHRQRHPADPLHSLFHQFMIAGPFCPRHHQLLAVVGEMS